MARSSSEVCDQSLVSEIVVAFVKYCDMRRLSRGDGRCSHKLLQRRRQGLSIGVYVNRNATRVSGLDRAFVTEYDVRGKRGISRGTHMFQGLRNS